LPTAATECSRASARKHGGKPNGPYHGPWPYPPRLTAVGPTASRL